MNAQADTTLAREVLVYRAGSAGVRQGWAAVAAALVFTFGMFVLLPFSALVTARRPETVRLRAVTTVPVPARVPEVRPLVPSRPQPRQQAIHTPAAAPRLETPVSREKPRLDLTVSLGAAVEFPADFDMTLTVRPPTLPPLTAWPEPAPPPEPAAFAMAALDSPPRPIVQMPPTYPYAARMRNVEGSVELMFTVTEAGRVTDIEIAEAVPGDVFVDSVRRAVARWRFEPGRKDGQPVPARMRIRLRFDLK